MKYYLFLLLSLISYQLEAQIQIGSGTLTQTNVPINTNWGYNYSQQIYLASEIGVSGTITSIQFYCGAAYATNSTSWVVYMGHTSQASFSNSTNWIPATSLTNVFAGTVSFTSNNWMTVVLDSPFIYNGTDNLVIAVDENSPNFASTSSSWRYTTTANSTSIYYRNDSINPDPASPPAATGTSSSRTNVILGGLTLPTCLTPTDQATNLSFNSVTSTTITASFTAATAVPSGYLVVRSTSATPPMPVDGTTYAIGSTALGANTNVIANGSSTSFTSSSLISNTTYYYHVISYNSTSCSGGPKYNFSSPLVGSVTTCLSGTPSVPSLSNETTNSIQVSLTPFTGATTYRLDVSTNNSFSSYVTGYQDLVVNGTSYVITGLSPNTLYYVRIRAHNESCPSSNSNAASRTTLKIEPSNQPTNFAASSASTNSISLSWTAAVAGSQLPDGYLISAISDPVDGTDPGTGSLALSSGVASYKTSSSSGTFTGHTAGTMYFYKIYSYTNASTGIDFKTNNVPNLYQATQPNNSGTPVFTSTPLNAGQATITWVQPSGFDAAKHPPYLTMALGAGSVTPWQMVTAYAVFANGGYKINPYVVREIRDDKNQILAQSTPVPAGDDSIRAIDPRNAFMMDNMMRDVTIYGTAARASVALKRQDLAGKTGTTNEYMDAWFCGYQMTVAGCAWLGFDQPKTLGTKETGGSAALPIWIGYMTRALQNVPMRIPTAPEGLIASGDGRGRNFIYAENAVAAVAVDENASEDIPPPKPDLSSPPSD